jgi:hypothetical protein
MTHRRWARLGLALAGLGVACTEQDTASRPNTASPVEVASAPSAAAPPPAPPSPTPCPDPSCPLFDWMETQMEPALVTSDFTALATQFDAVAAWAPPGYANWASIARDGASAARVGAADAVRAACRSCHAQYGTRYEHALRSHPM